MFAVSKDYAPPLKLIAPFFQIGVIFYLVSTILLLKYNSSFSYIQMDIAGWLHLFLLGFVMVIIFGAMAQLIPVVLEVGHAYVDAYYAILPLLSVGTVVMVAGFLFNPSIISYGGVLVLASMIIFALEAFFTLKNSKIGTITVQTVAISNSFLLIGIITGFIIALNFSGFLSLEIENLLKAHLFSVLGGFVLITIMGISLTLLPMFSLAHGFNERPIKIGFYLVSAGVGVIFLSSVLNIDEFISYPLIFAGVLAYLYQVYIIYTLRVRKELDIWLKSMIFGYISLFVSLIFGLLALLPNAPESFLHTSIWFFVVGFIGFLINGHLYKIVPFLVWFERFSPLVGKKKVPMLHEMYPKKQADFMFYYTACGVVVGGIGLFIENDFLFKFGASLLIMGAIFLFTSMVKMLSYGKGENV
jgi:hypothetical protein